MTREHMPIDRKRRRNEVDTSDGDPNGVLPRRGLSLARLVHLCENLSAHENQGNERNSKNEKDGVESHCSGLAM